MLSNIVKQRSLMSVGEVLVLMVENNCDDLSTFNIIEVFIL